MDDITRERVWRKLQVLPDAQLFQVLDYIEFLEGKYAAGKASEPTGLQRFAERLQDRLRGRSVAPDYIAGAVGVLGMARRVVDTGREVVSGVVQTGLGVVDEVVEAGRELLSEAPAHPGEASLPAGVQVTQGTPALVGESVAGAAPAAPVPPEASAALGDATAPPPSPAEEAGAAPPPPPGAEAAPEGSTAP